MMKQDLGSPLLSSEEYAPLLLSSTESDRSSRITGGTPRRTLLFCIALIGAIIAGVFNVTQALLNSELLLATDDSIWSGAYIMLSTTIALIPLTLCWPGSFLGGLRDATWVVRRKPSRSCMFLGCGTQLLYIYCATVCPPVVGLSLFFILNVLGQIVTCLLVDSLGLPGIPKRPVRWPGWVGGVLVVAGTIIFQSSGISSLPALDLSTLAFHLLLSLISGACSVITATLTLQLSGYIGLLRALLLGYFLASVIFLLGCAIQWNPPPLLPHADLWKTVGGLFGCAANGINPVAGKIATFSTYYSFVVAGQLSFAALLNSFGWGGAVRTMGVREGAGLAVVGAGVAAFAWGRGQAIAGRERRKSSESLA